MVHRKFQSLRFAYLDWLRSGRRGISIPAPERSHLGEQPQVPSRWLIEGGRLFRSLNASRVAANRHLDFMGAWVVLHHPQPLGGDASSR